MGGDAITIPSGWGFSAWNSLSKMSDTWPNLRHATWLSDGVTLSYQKLFRYQKTRQDYKD